MEINWSQDKVVYQIYPKSFQDTDHNGIGDLAGVIQRLDYLQFLGVDIIWLTPIYPSPQIDNGYDVSDYFNIDPLYGSMEDFERLVQQAHLRNIRIMMDMVFNHTSTEHPWFIQACDPTSQFHPFYIWHEAPEKGLPTNWLSKFGGSAWQWQEDAGKYYLHLFSPQQADLNWEHPPVRQAIKDICQFWAAKGVDAFRLDVINLISKPAEFVDDPNGEGRQFYTDGPKVHQYLQELSRDVFQPLGLITVGEMSSTTLSHCQQYAAIDHRELTMAFNFHHLKVDYPQGNKWCLARPNFVELKQIINYWQQGMHQRANTALFWGNHDQPRVVSRFGEDRHYRVVSAKMLAMVLYGMQGTPFIFQGEEIGMTNAGFTDISHYRDIESLSFYSEQGNRGIPTTESLAILATKSRDNSRTPMQWDEGVYAGFSHAAPWISLNPNYRHINVAAAIADPDSILHTYRALIRLRKQYEVIQFGDYIDLLPEHPEIWCYLRRWNNQRLLVVANLTSLSVDWSPPTLVPDSPYQLLWANSPTVTDYPTAGRLEPYQAAWWLCTEDS
ncbi:alpha,alpha-phosphotrehalase [Rosenbergiella nectarea]|uniref:alpha,alpha-phosphotrehalase n=1 Tax=Rosenbergiella nectarea TaxID=988801 RepID=UPI001BD976AC|nr:alpha,alpha-phosphotrehalase [Rosenbergiella nectarea]MBT0729120.1 alpha,alpha-phosphotrehalase [Rosenbergiella nectarea subsp. apis]